MSNDRWGVVTGSSSGIGRTTAETLARDGWNVVVHGRSESDHAREAVESVRSHGTKVIFIPADCGDPEAIEPFVERVWKETGGVETWIHNAGVDLLTGDNLKKTFMEKLRLATTIDLWGTILACRAAGQRMVEQGHGSIVTIGWDQSATGMGGDSGEFFTAIKGGVMAFTRSLARSLAPKVRVNCIAPGWIRTAWGAGASDYWQERVLEETPLDRWGVPEDVAEAIAFLVSDRATFLTGQILNINGGVVFS